MITKILITLAVITACYFYLKFKRKRAAGDQSPTRRIPETDIDPKPPFRLLAVVLVFLALVGGASVAGYHWFDGRTLLSVQLTPAGEGESRDYQVYKRDLELRRFTTVEGQIVRVADSDRLIVTEIPEG
ncbi:hypothetical protein [Aliamphritea ceti]|uniref:hypothetical protein n=1 Tax=Aliamphritea ceti TaxID=1524258 RepID=UPI0021C2DF14|nr:hypothetical protein [Aliamphritea ceti]